MKVVILAGGKGTRISEYTKSIPKPMVQIGSKPILEHIINYYMKFGFKDFIIASGYKHSIIKDYFKKQKIPANIDVINTGRESLTGTRLVKLTNKLKETFMLTYGDGLSNVNLDKLIKFHNKKNKLVTVTAVRPPARFGAIKIIKDKVQYFREKNNLDSGWINGGFFVMKPKFLNFINGDNTYLEQEPFKKITQSHQLVAFKHTGFWQCMDTLRDKEILEKKIKNKEHLE